MKTNWAEIGIGAALLTGSIIDLVPGDEVLGVPLGVILIAHGFGVRL